MDKRQRITLLGIAAAIAAVAVAIALIAGGGDDDNPDTTAATQATETQETQQDTRATTTAEEPEPPKPEATSIRVEGGEAVGGTEKITVNKGDRVMIDVRADAADEAHLHGYDITKDLGPGKTAKFRFDADIEGVFELELHNSGGQLAKITVKP